MTMNPKRIDRKTKSFARRCEERSKLISEVNIPISGMSCASCAANIEKGLSKLPGVLKANVNFATEKATVEFDPDITTEATFIDTVKELGYEAKIQSPDTQKVIIPISGMSCAACVAKIEKTLTSGYRYYRR